MTRLATESAFRAEASLERGHHQLTLAPGWHKGLVAQSGRRPFFLLAKAVTSIVLFGWIVNSASLYQIMMTIGSANMLTSPARLWLHRDRLPNQCDALANPTARPGRRSVCGGFAEVVPGGGLFQQPSAHHGRRRRQPRI